MTPSRTTASSKPNGSPTTSSDQLDLAIIGSGPAALTAAIYAARAGLTTRVYERAVVGGALNEIAQLENFPGFEGPGAGLAQQMRRQAEQFGVEIVDGDCTDIRRPAQGCELLVDGQSVSARAVLIATGSAPRPLGVAPAPSVPSTSSAPSAPPSPRPASSGSDTASMPPVSYCALCDGALAKGEAVVVVGGGNAAAQEAIYLAGLARHVTLITHSALKADAYLQSTLRKLPNVAVREDVEPTAPMLAQFDHIFVAIGKLPASKCLRRLADTILSDPPLLDPQGYVLTGANPTFPHATSVPGLFAAGDVRGGAIRQAVTAAGDGAAAAIEIFTWLRDA